MISDTFKACSSLIPPLLTNCFFCLNLIEISSLNKKCLDIGSSTGGFTDCLLQRRAHSVVAIDTGYGQAADKIRNDSRVMLSERTNARYMDRLEKPVNLVVIDVSFISILKIIPNVLLF